MGLFFNNQDIANAGITEKAVLYSRSRFSWELSEIRAAKPDGARLLREAPAAFGRLRVETLSSLPVPPFICPAAFGRLRVETVITPFATVQIAPAAFGRLRVETTMGMPFGAVMIQPPSGGCVLKLGYATVFLRELIQPPSGGCVLKQTLFVDALATVTSRLRAAAC